MSLARQRPSAWLRVSKVSLPAQRLPAHGSDAPKPDGRTPGKVCQESRQHCTCSISFIVKEFYYCSYNCFLIYYFLFIFFFIETFAANYF